MFIQPRLPSLRKVERFLFRPAFVFFTFTLVLLAIVQSSGRFTMAVLGVFEEEINAVLATWNINVTGLQGTWQGLNPILRVAHARFPAGEVTALEAELDLMESLVRSTFVARRIRVAQARVHLEQHGPQWRLRGARGQDPEIDISRLLQHSDEISGQVRIHLHATDGLNDVLEAQLFVANHGGLHHGELSIRNLRAPEQQLSVSTWRRDEMWLTQPAANSARVSGGLLVPEAWSGMPALTVQVDNTFWGDIAEVGAGALEVSLRGLESAATQAIADINVAVDLERQEQRLRGRTRETVFAVGEDRFVLSPVYIDGRVPEEAPSQLEAAAELLMWKEDPPLLMLWIEQLDLGEISSFFQRHLGDWGAAGRWVKALSVQGRANNVHAFFDTDLGIGYMASVADINMQGYKGAPAVNNVQGQLWGHDRAVAMQVKGTDTYMGFPDLYREGWLLDSVQGVVKTWFADGYFGMRGTHLRARLGETDVGGGYAVSRPPERYEQRLSLQIEGDEVDLSLGKSFVPVTVPEALSEWLLRGPRSGRLSDARFALHGQLHLRPGELGRRIELLGDLSGGRVEYLKGWPEVTDIRGSLHVAGVDIRVDVLKGHSQELQIRSAQIVLQDNSAYLIGSVDITSDAAAALKFVRSSPLWENLDFISAGWQGSGRLDISGDLIIPIKKEGSPPLSIDLDFDATNVSLAMPDYRMVTHQVTGSGAFSLPHHLQGDFTASLFGHPARIHAHFNDDWVLFDLQGRAAPDDVYGLLEAEFQLPVSGQFDFDSVLSIAMTGGVTNLFVASDFAGLGIDLPGEFAKEQRMARAGDVNIQFLKDYRSVSWRYQNTIGWLHYGDGIERGAIGVGIPPPMTAQDERAIVIAGHMQKLVLSDWVSGEGGSAVALPLDWVIKGLRVDDFVIGDMSFADLVLSGAQRGEDVQFTFDASTLQGSVTLPASDIMTIDLDYVRIPDMNGEPEDHEGVPRIDPVTVAEGQSLPAAKVSITQLDLDDEPFGAWQFVIEPEEDKVIFNGFAASINGVHIEDSVLVWDLARDHSSFAGLIKLDDLGQTLPRWGYAPSLTTDKVRVIADVHWQGSPLNLNLIGTSGRVDFEASDGRFIEVDSPGSGLRIMSLLNFTKITKRISLDFSDVVGEGISFEKIDAKVDLDVGELTFPRRMKVESSAGDFRVGGRVDLRSGVLDNEMIVTLPVSKSLPWYGVYLALANPLAGLGVVVGERVLRKPLEQFSTAKFEIKGTLDEPEIKFVGLWEGPSKPSTVPATSPEQEPGTNNDADLEAELENALGSLPSSAIRGAGQVSLIEWVR